MIRREAVPNGLCYLNKSPYEKVGKSVMYLFLRKKIICLNESPYEKVGKSLMHNLIASCSLLVTVKSRGLLKRVAL